MNIFLVPYTWLRHFQVAIFTGAAAMVAWWVVLTWMVVVGPQWSIGYDGMVLLVAVVAASSGSATLAEGTLRRLHPAWRVSRTALSAAISGGMTAAWYLMWHNVTMPVLMPEILEADYTDPSLVSLRYRSGIFVMAGLTSSLGPLIVRKGAFILDHLLAGICAGMAFGAAWHVSNFTAFYDLYLAGAFGAFAMGGTLGLLAWGIPDELYAGWLRVLKGSRYAHRIPIDALERSHKERFLGHFPRGLDMWLPVEEGVLELHASVVVDAEQNYRARGLTLHSVRVKRFLESIDIRYDPRRPAPLETRLTPGDRLVLGEGKHAVELEFLMLPREEK
ncbi:MAG: hypothetical protein GY913_28660 [Proteobacteria bacterium]|nr:hypothetical protein [Pseudomonadota bacterium]MCP4920885.1 hypothetical protein [Pseudomonadota bacterium]